MISYFCPKQTQRIRLYTIRNVCHNNIRHKTDTAVNRSDKSLTGCQVIFTLRLYYRSLLQQALTFAESLMPEEIMKRGLLLFDLPRLNERGISLAAVKRDNGKSYQSDNTFLFDTFINFGVIFFTGRRKRILENEAAEQDYEGKSYIAAKALSILVDHASDVHAFIACEGRRLFNYEDLRLRNVLDNADGFRVRYMQNFITVPARCYFTDEARTQFGILLLMHKLIKNFRNMFNHSSASGLRPTADQLKTLLGLYVEYANHLMSD